MTFIFLLCILCCSMVGCLGHEPKKGVDPSQNIERSYEESLQREQSLGKLQSQFALKPDEFVIIIDISEQKLRLIKDEKIVKIYPVSTSKYGVDNKKDSNKTPLGIHRIAKKIGEGAPIGAIFESRMDTGKIAEIYTDKTEIQEDLVTTRIMWLEGLETGVNKGNGIDSYERCIYIHGTQEEGLIGEPASHGCIRMKNNDVVELFDLVTINTLVEIQE